MFEHGSFRPGGIIKACRAKVTAVTKRHAASSSCRRQYPNVTSDQEKTRQKSSLRSSFQIFATNTFSRRSRWRRRTEESYNSHDSTTSSSTLFVQPSDIEEYFKSDLEQTATQKQISPSISSSEIAVAPAETDIPLQSPKPTPGLGTSSANIQKTPARYRLRIQQLTREAAERAEMEKDNKVAENRVDTKPRGLPRSATSYRLSSLAIRGGGSNIPLPSSSSTSFGFSTATSRRMSQQNSVSSGSHSKFPPRRSSIVQRHRDAATEQKAEDMPTSSHGFSKGTVNNPTRVTSGVPAIPQRQLMQPLAPPFPRSQTLAGPAFHPAIPKVTEKKEPSNPVIEEVEDNNTEISFDMCEVVEDEETVDEDEETVEVLKSTCPPKSEIEKERKWKLTPLERIGNKVGVETASELPAEGPPEGGWLWGVDDARLVKTAQPQQYWLGRFSTILNSFHHEDSFKEPDSATGNDKTSGLSKPTSLGSGHLDEHRIKRAFVALESMCATPEATESFKEFRTAYCRRFGDQWSKWLVVGREEEDTTSVMGGMSRVFLKRGERRTPEPRSERKTSGGYGGKFNNILRSMRRSLA